MAVTLVVWNVETFGDRWNAARGADYVPVCNFMAQALHAANADILVMMELRRSGSQYLPTLRTALHQLDNATWTFDFIPGSVVNKDPEAALTLGYTLEGHAEGYAVFWRTDHQEFQVLTTREAHSGRIADKHSRIDLVLSGRSSNPNSLSKQGWYNAPCFDPAHPPAPWLRLDFPAPKPNVHGGTRWNLARRPCYFVLRLDRPGEQGNQLLPVVVYHAPLGHMSTAWGVQLSGYSTGLYQADDTGEPGVTMVSVNQAIMAGDFNVDYNDRDDKDHDAYLVFTNFFGKGGASLLNVWVNSDNPADNYTAVRLSNGRQPIMSDNVNDYRYLAIDNLFSRGLNAVEPPAAYGGPVYNLLGGLRQGGFLVNSPAKRAVIQSFRNAIITALGNPLNPGFENYPHICPKNKTPSKTRKREVDSDYYVGPVIGGLHDYNAYLTDLNNGHFTSARRAAEFYRNSISDHLPVVYRFTI